MVSVDTKVVDTVSGDTNTFSFTASANTRFYDNGVVNQGYLDTCINRYKGGGLAVSPTPFHLRRDILSVSTRMGGCIVGILLLRHH